MAFRSTLSSPRRALVGGLAALICSVMAATAFFGWRGSANKHELTAVRQDRAVLERQLAAAEGKLRQERERLAETDADNQRLIDAIASGAIPSVAAQPRLTREEMNARYQRGQTLETTGDPAGALAEYLWCFDLGFRPHDLLKRMTRLGEIFSPALEAMIDRRDRAEARVLGDPQDVETMSDVVALNRALGDDAHTLAVYDRLPDGAARRTQGDRSMLEVFLSNQRYVDAMRVLPFEKLKEGLDRVANMSAAQAAKDRAQQQIISASGGTEAQQQMQRLAIQRARHAQRQAAIVESAVGIEILAGAGEVPRALEIARALLAFDSSTETRALVEKHANRAGHADLLQSLSQ